jgi:hypothetical protein
MEDLAYAVYLYVTVNKLRLEIHHPVQRAAYSPLSSTNFQGGECSIEQRTLLNYGYSSHFLDFAILIRLLYL